MKLRALKKLGLPALADDIYLLLLKKGVLSVSEIARGVGKYRPRVYAMLALLADKGLVRQGMRGRRKIYSAESPTLIQSLLKRTVTEVRGELAAYQEIFDAQKSKPAITFFEEKAGIEDLYEYFIASVPRDGVIYRYESPKDYTQNKKHYPKLYFKRASRFGDIDKYVITNEKTHNTRHNSINRLSKSVPRALGSFDYDVMELISGDKVAFIDYKTKSAIVIENDRFGAFQKKLFQLLFEKL